MRLEMTYVLEILKNTGMEIQNKIAQAAIGDVWSSFLLYLIRTKRSPNMHSLFNKNL